MSIEIARHIKRSQLFKRHPELLAVIGEVKFYECPIHGDERPLIAVTDKVCGYSHFYDVPTLEELLY